MLESQTGTVAEGPARMKYRRAGKAGPLSAATPLGLQNLSEPAWRFVLINPYDEFHGQMVLVRRI
jgi:hypothetical protein